MIQKAHTEGHEKGLAEGKMKGLAEGKMKGLAEGLAEGENNAKIQIAINLLKLGMPINSIANITGLTQDIIEKLKS